MIQEQEQTAPATIDGAATVASEILGKLLPEPFDEWGWNCHNPVIIVDADGLSIGPDSTLVPHDGTEHDLDCLGDMDPDGAVNRIARRLENIPPEFWERHPVRQAAIRQWLEEQLEEYSVGCDE